MEIIEWLKLNWLTILVSSGLSWAGVMWLPSKFIELKYSKSLEKYKVGLQEISESTKFQYQRKLVDFNLYTSKKHKCYINLYEAMVKAEGYVFSLHGLSLRSNYEWCN